MISGSQSGSVVSSEILGKWRRGGQSSLPSDRLGLFYITIGVCIRVCGTLWIIV